MKNVSCSPDEIEEISGAKNTFLVYKKQGLSSREQQQKKILQDFVSEKCRFSNKAEAEKILKILLKHSVDETLDSNRI